MIEAVIAFLITSIVFLGLSTLMSSSQQSTIHTQETTARLLTEIILFQSIENDVKGMAVNDMQMTIDPQPVDLVNFQPNFMAFAFLDNGKLIIIKYEYLSSKKAVIRTESSFSGKPIRSTTYGAGTVENFSIETIDEGSQVKVTLILGKHPKDEYFIRFFSRGRQDREDTQYWQHNIK